MIGAWPLGDGERRDLNEAVKYHVGRRVMLVTGNLPVAHWHGLVGGASLGHANLDRLVHDTYRMKLTGGSMRRMRKSTRGAEWFDKLLERMRMTTHIVPLTPYSASNRCHQPPVSRMANV